MADREVRVVVLGDSSSLQSSMVKGEAATASFETRMKNAVIVTGEAGALSDGLARKMNSLEQLGLTPASVGLIGLAAGVGIAVNETKTLIDRSAILSSAYDNLNNAIADNGYQTKSTTALLDNFLTTNKRYIADQAVVIDGYSNMLRAGVPVANLQRDMTLALDLSVSRHTDLATTMKAVTDAELGRTLGLVNMGVNVKDLNAQTVDSTKDTSEYNKTVVAVTSATTAHATAVQKLADWESLHYGILTRTQAQYIQERDLKQKVVDTTNNLATATAAETAAHDALAPAIDKTNAGLSEAAIKYLNAHLTLDNMTQAQDDLNHSQDDFAKRYGPAMRDALANGLDIVNLSVQAIGILATDTNNFLGNLGDWARNTRGAAGQPHDISHTQGGASNASFSPPPALGTQGGATINIAVTGPDPSATSALVAAHLARMLS